MFVYPSQYSFWPLNADLQRKSFKKKLIIVCSLLKLFPLLSLLSVSYWLVVFLSFCTSSLFMFLLNIRGHIDQGPAYQFVGRHAFLLYLFLWFFLNRSCRINRALCKEHTNRLRPTFISSWSIKTICILCLVLMFGI